MADHVKKLDWNFDYSQRNPNPPVAQPQIVEEDVPAVAQPVEFDLPEQQVLQASAAAFEPIVTPELPAEEEPATNPFATPVAATAPFEPETEVHVGQDIHATPTQASAVDEETGLPIPDYMQRFTNTSQIESDSADFQKKKSNLENNLVLPNIDTQNSVTVQDPGTDPVWLMFLRPLLFHKNFNTKAGKFNLSLVLLLLVSLGGFINHFVSRTIRLSTRYPETFEVYPTGMGVFDSWLWFWFVMVLGSLTVGLLGPYLAGWWYAYRLNWCLSENNKISDSVGRNLKFISYLPIALFVIIYSFLEVFIYDHPYHSMFGAVNFGGLEFAWTILISLGSLVVIAYAISVSYRGVKELFPEADQGKLTKWFLILPIMFYAYAVLGNLALLYGYATFYTDVVQDDKLEESYGQNDDWNFDSDYQLHNQGNLSLDESDEYLKDNLLNAAFVVDDFFQQEGVFPSGSEFPVVFYESDQIDVNFFDNMYWVANPGDNKQYCMMTELTDGFFVVTGYADENNEPQGRIYESIDPSLNVDQCLNGEAIPGTEI